MKGTRGDDGIPLDETELGLREFGLRFIHARLARAKPIERVIGALQNGMEGEPGYCGRKEQTEIFERVRRDSLDVNARRIHPAGKFLSADQWIDRLETICASYNGEPQNGKMTQGLSPDDAFIQFQNYTQPQVKLDAACRHLLANHRRPIRVGRNGVTLMFGKQRFNYKGQETGPLIGQTVLAWFDPENPEFVTLTDMNRKNPVMVARSLDVPAIDAPEELVSREMARIAAHQEYARVRYRILKQMVPPPFRRNLADASTVDLGRRIKAEKDAIQVRREEMGNLCRVIRNKAAEAGMPEALLANEPDLVDKGLSMMLQAQRSNEKKNTEPPDSEGDSNE